MLLLSNWSGARVKCFKIKNSMKHSKTHSHDKILQKRVQQLVMNRQKYINIRYKVSTDLWYCQEYAAWFRADKNSFPVC